MAPLLIGDINNPNDPATQGEWELFKNNLKEAKARGVEAVSTDLWWGALEPVEGEFRWDYYDKLSQVIEDVGLKWIPIISFHQLGGNVGDSGYVPLPDWVWKKHIGKKGIIDESSLMFQSEQGKRTKEYISFWGTEYVLEDYERVMKNFVAHFSDKAHMISEINISLGPAGELRYPSYNGHDIGTAYPHRGGLQAYSPLAVFSFQQFAEEKFESIEKLNSSWGFNLTSFDQVYPPNPKRIDEFYGKGEHFSAYGKDFFDWYNKSLLEHGRLVIGSAFNIFHAEDSSLKKIPLGSKVPGIHWRIGTDRLAELPAGLLRTSYQDWRGPSSNYGYHDLLEFFKEMDDEGKGLFHLHFTALEMDNGDGGPQVASEAKSLVFWFSEGAKAKGVKLMGENALDFKLFNPRGWDNIIDALTWGNYYGITLLRLNELIGNEAAREGMVKLNKFVKTKNSISKKSCLTLLRQTLK